MMNLTKKFASAVVMLPSLALPQIVFGACSHSTDIRNNSSITLRIVELKSSSSPPVFKSQWKGARNIQPGSTGTISWTSDLGCIDGFGDPNIFDVKLIRKNGKKHYCGDLEPSQDVRINTPDLCYAS